jgi:predicted nucleic acid-binding protein
VAVPRIVDASPVIFLSRVGLLEALRIESSRVILPERVAEEILAAHDPSDPAVEAIKATDWLEVQAAPPTHSALRGWILDPGETSVISLALSLPGHEVILDDVKARRCAASLGIPTSGTLGLLILAKEIGMIREVHPIIERLLKQGMFLSSHIVDLVLARVGETR